MSPLIRRNGFGLLLYPVIALSTVFTRRSVEIIHSVLPFLCTFSAVLHFMER